MYISFHNSRGGIYIDINTGRIRVMTYDTEDEWSRGHNFGGKEAWSAVSGTLSKGELEKITHLVNKIETLTIIEKPNELHGFGMNKLSIVKGMVQSDSSWNEGSTIPMELDKCVEYIIELGSRGK